MDNTVDQDLESWKKQLELAKGRLRFTFIDLGPSYTNGTSLLLLSCLLWGELQISWQWLHSRIRYPICMTLKFNWSSRALPGVRIISWREKNRKTYLLFKQSRTPWYQKGTCFRIPSCIGLNVRITLLHVILCAVSLLSGTWYIHNSLSVELQCRERHRLGALPIFI